MKKGLTPLGRGEVTTEQKKTGFTSIREGKCTYLLHHMHIIMGHKHVNLDRTVWICGLFRMFGGGESDPVIAASLPGHRFGLGLAERVAVHQQFTISLAHTVLRCTTPFTTTALASGGSFIIRYSFSPIHNS